MTDKSNLELKKQALIEGGEISEQGEILSLSDSERRAKYGANGSRRASLSKREMMEELSRERFPWEE